MIRGVLVLAFGAVLTNGALSALSPLCHAARAPQLAVAETNDTHIAYSGGEGTSLKDAVVIKGATNLIDLILAEGRWLSNNYPGLRVSSINPHWRLKAGVYDVIEIRTTRQKEEKIYFRFSEKSLAETSIDAIWTFYISDLLPPYGDGFCRMHEVMLEDYMKRIDPKRSVPYLVAQLRDRRLTNTSFSDPFGDGKFREQRVCDFAARLLSRDLRYTRSKEAVFPNYPWKPFKSIPAIEKPDEAVEAIKKWWHVEGRFLTEQGEIEWGTVPFQ